jgi:hypothetical protein
MTNTLQTQQQKLFEELDYRDNDGIEVSLLWNRHDDTLTVFVVDTRDQSGAEITVGARNPREVFEHPYAYLPAGR